MTPMEMYSHTDADDNKMDWTPSEGNPHREALASFNSFDDNLAKIDRTPMTNPHLPICIVESNGFIRHYRYSDANQAWQLHREDPDLPSVIYNHPDGSQNIHEWYQNGVLHRDPQPAVIYGNGVKEWYQHGVLMKRIDESGIETVMNEEKEQDQNEEEDQDNQKDQDDAHDVLDRHPILKWSIHYAICLIAMSTASAALWKSFH